MKYGKVKGALVLFTDEDSVAATQVAGVSGTSQVGHQLQVISVTVHKARHRYDLRERQRERSTSHTSSGRGGQGRGHLGDGFNPLPP